MDFANLGVPSIQIVPILVTLEHARTAITAIILALNQSAPWSINSAMPTT
jgi:hypothetical protein